MIDTIAQVGQQVIGDTSLVGIFALLLYKTISERRNNKPDVTANLERAITKLATAISVQTEVLRAVKDDTSTTRNTLLDMQRSQRDV